MDKKELEIINRVTRTILRRLYDDRIIGEKHTAVENLRKGFAKDMGYYTDKAIKNLFKESLIIPKKTSYEKHCSLNHNKIEKIERMIGYM